MIVPIRHYKVPIDGDHYVVRPVESCVRTLTVNEDCLPVAVQCVDNGARPCHRVNDVVDGIHHTILDLPKFASVPSKGGQSGSWKIVFFEALPTRRMSSVNTKIP